LPNQTPSPIIANRYATMIVQSAVERCFMGKVLPYT
jgi:hypothetical protein